MGCSFELPMPSLGSGVLGRHLLALSQRIGPGEFHSLRNYVTGDEPLDSALQQLAGVRTVIAYCDADQGCARSLQVASRLRHAGVSDVRVLEGGMPDWLQRGYPAESGACGQCEGQP